MNFRSHSELRDKHAFLSPSSYHWLRYDAERLRKVYLAQLRKAEGTKLHALAKDLITMGVMLPQTDNTFNTYVNDCIICHMKPEQPLFYSWNCYGTADAIGLEGMTLRIFDLKTGLTKASMEQLKIYAALFFLEYGAELDLKPDMVETELRIYQSGAVTVEMPHPSEIYGVMHQIIDCDNQLNQMEGERLSWKNEF